VEDAHRSHIELMRELNAFEKDDEVIEVLTSGHQNDMD
jgi:hypothetical protein